MSAAKLLDVGNEKYDNAIVAQIGQGLRGLLAASSYAALASVT